MITYLNQPPGLFVPKLRNGSATWSNSVNVIIAKDLERPFGYYYGLPAYPSDLMTIYSDRLNSSPEVGSTIE